jgi:hypothetical protein
MQRVMVLGIMIVNGGRPKSERVAFLPFLFFASRTIADGAMIIEISTGTDC